MGFKVRMFREKIKKEEILMKKTLMAFLAAVVMAQLIVSVALAGETKTIQVKATIPAQNGLNVEISKVTGNTWTTATAVDFGTLALDPTYNIYKTADGSYYAVDVGVNSNAGTWTVTHSAGSIDNGTANLNNKINVAFVNQTTNGGVTLSNVSYLASHGKVINKANISEGGWLRIYYGLASGTGDAPGVVVIPASQTSGSYAGTITLTLAP